jgi:ABC-type multidrug transport system permease subunit
MNELISGTKAKLNDENYSAHVFPHPLPFNIIPHIDKFQVLLILFFVSFFFIVFCLFSLMGIQKKK